MSEDRSALGWKDGLRAFLAGIGFVVRTPSVWLYALVPAVTALLLTLLLGCLLSTLSAWGASKIPMPWADEEGSNWSVAARWAVLVSSVVVALIASVLASLALAQPLSGWALEEIARRHEQALTGRTPPDLSFFASLGLSVRVTLFTLVAGTVLVGALFLVGVIVPPLVVVTVPLKLLVVAWLLAWDFLDYPLGIHGQGLRQRAAWVSRNRRAVTTFGLAWTVVLLIPFISLLVLPLGVAGAAFLAAAGRGEASEIEIVELPESSDSRSG